MTAFDVFANCWLSFLWGIAYIFADFGGVLNVLLTGVCSRSLCQQLNFVKRPARDACLCMGELPAPPALPAPHFVFLITL